MLSRIAYPMVVAALAVAGTAGCNSTPVANDDAVTTSYARGVEADVLANDFDKDEDTLKLCHVGKPMNGSAALRNDHTIVYTPNPGFTGQDEVEYTVTDEDDPDDRDADHLARGVLTVTVQPPQTITKERETIVVPASTPKSSEEESGRSRTERGESDRATNRTSDRSTTSERANDRSTGFGSSSESMGAAAAQPDWTSETVLLKKDSSTVIVKGPFLIRGMMWSGNDPVRFELGPTDTSIRGRPREAIALPTGQVEFYVPPGQVLYAEGEGTLTYSGYRR